LPPFFRQPLAAQPERPPGIRHRGDVHFHRSRRGRHANLAAEHGILEVDREAQAQIAPLHDVAVLRRDLERQQEVARLGTARPRPAQPTKTDDLSVRHARGERDLHLPPPGERDSLLRLRRDVLDVDRQGRLDIVASAVARPPAAPHRVSKELREDVLAAAPRPARPNGLAPPPNPNGETLARAAGSKPLEALEARLAVGVNLAAIELGALLGISEDLVGGIDLGELVLSPSGRSGCYPGDSAWQACGTPS
jgi:hypothetical protein